MRIFTPQNEYVMRKLLYLVIGLLFVFALPSGAQPECVFTHYSSEEGLSQNTVMNILQDRKEICGLPLGMASINSMGMISGLIRQSLITALT